MLLLSLRLQYPTSRTQRCNCVAGSDAYHLGGILPAWLSVEMKDWHWQAAVDDQDESCTRPIYLLTLSVGAAGLPRSHIRAHYETCCRLQVTESVTVDRQADVMWKLHRSTSSSSSIFRSSTWQLGLRPTTTPEILLL